MSKTRTLFITLALFTFTLLLAACRSNQFATPASDIGVQMQLSVAPNPPQVGQATLVISLHDENGEPINDAKINVRGDMNHAGMQPVLREGATGRDGDYQIPFEWTMGGDWFVVVTAELPDGLIVEQQFDYTVAGGMMDMEAEAEMNMDDMPATTEEAADN